MQFQIIRIISSGLIQVYHYLQTGISIPCYPCTRPLRLAWAVGPCHCQRCDCHINIDSWFQLRFLDLCANNPMGICFNAHLSCGFVCLPPSLFSPQSSRNFLSNLQVHVAFLNSSELRKSVPSQQNMDKLIPFGQIWEIFDCFLNQKSLTKILWFQVPSVAAVPGGVST